MIYGYLSRAASRRETPKFNCADNCGDGGVTWPPEKSVARCELDRRSIPPPPRPRHPAARDLRDATGITFAQLPIRRQYAVILMRRQWPLAMAFGNAARAIAHGHGHLSHTAHEDEQPTDTSLSRGEALTPRGSQPEQCGLKWVVRSHLAVHSPSSAALNGSSSSSDSKSSSSSSHAFASTSEGGSTCQIRKAMRGRRAEAGGGEGKRENDTHPLVVHVARVARSEPIRFEGRLHRLLRP